jgi:hypothetical protein
LKPDVIQPLRALPVEAHILVQTQYVVTLAHRLYVLAVRLPGKRSACRVSEQAAAIIHHQPGTGDQTDDFETLAGTAPPDSEALDKLKAAIDLIWCAAAFQREPSIRAALIDFMSGFTKRRRPIV